MAFGSLAALRALILALILAGAGCLIAQRVVPAYAAGNLVACSYPGAPDCSMGGMGSPSSPSMPSSGTTSIGSTGGSTGGTSCSLLLGPLCITGGTTSSTPLVQPGPSCQSPTFSGLPAAVPCSTPGGGSTSFSGSACSGFSVGVYNPNCPSASSTNTSTTSASAVQTKSCPGYTTQFSLAQTCPPDPTLAPVTTAAVTTPMPPAQQQCLNGSFVLLGTPCPNIQCADGSWVVNTSNCPPPPAVASSSPAGGSAASSCPTSAVPAPLFDGRARGLDACNSTSFNSALSGFINDPASVAADPSTCIATLALNGVDAGQAFLLCTEIAATAPVSGNGGSSAASASASASSTSSATTTSSAGATPTANTADPAEGTPCAGGDGTQTVGGVPCSYILQATQGSNVDLKALTACMSGGATDAAGKPLQNDELYNFCLQQQQQ